MNSIHMRGKERVNTRVVCLHIAVSQGWEEGEKWNGMAVVN